MSVIVIESKTRLFHKKKERIKASWYRNRNWEWWDYQMKNGKRFHALDLVKSAWRLRTSLLYHPSLSLLHCSALPRSTCHNQMQKPKRNASESDQHRRNANYKTYPNHEKNEKMIQWLPPGMIKTVRVADPPSVAWV